MLFIDEIHRLSASVEEILYPGMEDFQLDLLIGEGPTARSIRLNLPRFTLVGATTRAGLLTSPLRDRFGWSARHVVEYPKGVDVRRSPSSLQQAQGRLFVSQLHGRTRQAQLLVHYR